MALGSDPSDYELHGTLPAAWLVTLRVDQNGIAKANVREQRRAPSDLAELAGWARLENAPRPGGLGLPCSGISLEWRADDGMWKCEWDFDGAADPTSITFGDAATTTYEIDCAVTTAPIETHPRFLAIARQYGVTNKNYDKQGGFLGFPKTLNAGAGLSSVPGLGPVGAVLNELKNPLYGVEDFLVSQMIYRIGSATATLPPDFRKNLGRIDTPRRGGPGAPALEGRANWLKTTARATWRGNIFQTTEEWTASGPDGWNPDVYRPQG